MRLLIIADWAQTGFGRVGREIGRGLMERGWDIRVIGINWRGLGGEVASMESRGIESMREALDTLGGDPLLESIIPAGINGDAMGYNLTAPAVAGRIWPGWTPERILLVADPRAALDRLQRDGGACSRVPTFNYVPIEGVGLPPLWRAIWQNVAPVAMSRFGKYQLETLLDRPVPLIQHGVSVPFHPVSIETPGDWKGTPVISREQAKAIFSLAGRTVVLRTDRFIPRKNYAALFRVMRPVLAAHPEVVLVIHCAPTDEGGSLEELISREPGAVETGPGRWTHSQIVLTRAHDTFRGLTDEELNVLYNAADLYVSPTMAEGFGLTLAEAGACGIPVVTTDYAAGPEAIGEGAVLVPAVAHLTNVYAHEWALVDEPAMTAAVERLITRPAARAELSAAGRRHVARLTWDAAAGAFHDLLSDPAAAAA